jgi:aldehyde dehydrogenase
MLHQVIETLNARVAMRPRYDNFIGGKWVAPVDGKYFDNISPITGKPVCQIARSQAADVELALDAAHKAKDAWGKTAPAKRAEILNKVADRMQENLSVLAAVETIDNGKPIRETSFADIPLAIDLSAISPPASARRKARSARSTTIPWPITIMNRSAWSGRSSRGISRS